MLIPINAILIITGLQSCMRFSCSICKWMMAVRCCVWWQLEAGLALLCMKHCRLMIIKGHLQVGADAV